MRALPSIGSGLVRAAFENCTAARTYWAVDYGDVEGWRLAISFVGDGYEPLRGGSRGVVSVWFDEMEPFDWDTVLGR